MQILEKIVDSFAGGGGASEGIRRAIGRSPDIAINHDEDAIKMHIKNHPDCQHFVENVWKVDPRKVLSKTDIVGLFWCSPDCRHFSRAKGSKPVSPRVRGLAWVAVHWAETAKPRIIILENVREFQEWGPLIRKKDENGKDVVDIHGNPVLIPDPDRKGHSFRRFVGRLRNLGYVVEWRDLDAANFGAPTHRKRLFLIARRDKQPICWPEPTHCAPEECETTKLKPYRTAAECIDWSIPVKSIFDRKKPLAENTMRRIAKGLKRYVIDCAEPFVVTCNHSGEEFRGADLKKPFPTVTGARDAHGLIVPTIVRIGQTGGNGKYCNSPNEPLTTVTKKNEHLLVTPILVPRYGERKGQEPRAHKVTKPAPAVVPTGNGSRLVAAFLTKHFGGQVGTKLKKPLPTTTARGTQTQLTTAYMIHLNHGAKQWSSCEEPMRAVVAGGKHHAEVRAFLVKYYGTANGQDVNEPIHTLTNRARFGLVMVYGEWYEIVDIGMRMLTPRELARAQGFEDSYELTGTKTSQIAKIGNSVCPPIAEALVRANYPVKKPARTKVA